MAEADERLIINSAVSSELLGLTRINPLSMDAYTASSATLHFADGTDWTFTGGDDTGTALTRALAGAMRLCPAIAPATWNLVLSNGIPRGRCVPELPLILDSTMANASTTIPFQFLQPSNTFDLVDQLRDLGLLITSSVEARGGLLLHGALAEKEGRGILLAGPSDVGKTTASRRLPLPWRSLSDDCALIVRDHTGQYQTHPWPTWSSFLQGPHDQSWDVQYSVPLQGIFLLKQSAREKVVALGPGQAACMLNEIAEQAWYGLNSAYDITKLQKLRGRRFHNICELVQQIPVYILHISRDGAFWEQIEQVL